MASSQKNSQSRAPGEASHPGPLSTKHLLCAHCPTWLSHSGTLRKHIQLRTGFTPCPVCVNGTSLKRMQWRSVNEDDDVASDPAKHGNADWTEESQKRLAQKSSLFCIQTSRGSSRGSLNSVHVSSS